ncbi:sporulation protein [Paenibacillus mesophilus]|uniref:sporulation protein YpjB n=1 Tax=Paenibacillus mesophilus TaxID=2582849 RepID=UPI00110D25A1|nr:sporulation protein YpjB [Paenibacillus mesophilus]TMV51248.1 sporulation protein [Paenibacillus mesophilus]
MFVFGIRRVGVACFVLFLVLGFAVGCGQERPAGADRTQATPEQLKQVGQLNAAADEMYRYVMDGAIDKARDKLEEIGSQMTGIRFEGITSVEGVGALSESIVLAKRVFQSVHFSQEEGQAAAAKIRLATDALTHANQPMWLQYYKGMKESAYRLEQGVLKRDKKEAAAGLEQLQLRYATIRPSLLISRPASQVEKMDSLLTFFRSQLSQPEIDLKQTGGALEHLRQELDELFGRRDRSAYVPIVERQVPASSILLFGSIIIVVLAYAAWRIFEFERNSFGGGNRHGGR